MKIASSFKSGELLAAISLCLGVAILISQLTPGLLLEAALWLWLPFLMAALFMLVRNPFYHSALIPHPAHFSLAIKLGFTFLILLLSYIGWGQGLWLYQYVTYSETGAPFFIQITILSQLLWALKLACLTWIIGAALALAMILQKKTKISDFFYFGQKNFAYGLVIDTLFTLSFIFLLLMFLVLGVIELSRSIITYLGFERPAYAELTALVSCFVLVTGYLILPIRKRSENLAAKSASLGRILFSQLGWALALFVLAQVLIVLLPMDWILPLARPIKNLFSHISYTQTWIALCISSAIVSAPILARYLVRSFAGVPAWKCMAFCAMPLLMSLIIYGLIPGSLNIFTFIPGTEEVPVSLENIVYQVQAAQYWLWAGILFLLCSFTYAYPLQMSLVDLMPSHLGKRLRRLRSIFAKQALLLFILGILYLFLNQYIYYFIGLILLSWTTLPLLWVSCTMLYSLKIKHHSFIK